MMDDDGQFIVVDGEVCCEKNCQVGTDVSLKRVLCSVKMDVSSRQGMSLCSSVG